MDLTIWANQVACIVKEPPHQLLVRPKGSISTEGQYQVKEKKKGPKTTDLYNSTF